MTANTPELPIARVARPTIKGNAHRVLRTTALSFGLVIGATGCASLPNPSRTQVGVATGAVVGGVVGAAATGTTTGTVIGAAAGALAGKEIAKRMK